MTEFDENEIDGVEAVDYKVDAFYVTVPQDYMNKETGVHTKLGQCSKCMGLRQVTGINNGLTYGYLCPDCNV